MPQIPLTEKVTSGTEETALGLKRFELLPAPPAPLPFPVGN